MARTPYIPELLLIDRRKGTEEQSEDSASEEDRAHLEVEALEMKPPSWRPAPLPAESVR